MFDQEIRSIQKTIFNYFEGVFYGDTKKLEPAFHPQCLLIGDINGQPYFKSLPEYLENVRNRKSPESSGEEFLMRILSIEVVNNVAIAKLHVPVLGFNYYDFMSLNKINKEWVIVNKVFSNL